MGSGILGRVNKSKEVEIMAEKEKPKKEIPKEPTKEEIRTNVINDLTFVRNITNYVKQMKDNGCLAVSVETDIKTMIEEQARAILGLPSKPVPVPYSPPVATPTPTPGYPPQQYPRPPG